MYEIIEYLRPDGKDPYRDWLLGLADRRAQARILMRINRMEAGSFGDHKPLSAGVWELRIDWGPGYRLYYAQAGKRLILLLAGAINGDNRPILKRQFPIGRTGKRERRHHDHIHQAH